MMVSGNIEEKSSLPTGVDGLPVAVHFEPFDTDNEKVYRVRKAEALPLLDDSKYKFLDDYDPLSSCLDPLTNKLLLRALWIFMMSIVGSIPSTANSIAGKRSLG